MSPSTKPAAVLLPGTGSDARFVQRAFAESLVGDRFTPIFVQPDPTDLIAGYRRALDAAAGQGTIVGGVSLGAAVAIRWAATRPDGCAAVVAALPAWTGAPDEAPAALSARLTAEMLADVGLERSIDRMAAGSPAWLAQELTRSWRGQWPQLPAALLAASRYAGPTPDELARVSVPTAVIAGSNDPVHPLGVARQWCAHLPTSELSTLTLDELGADPSRLGSLANAALIRLGVLT